MENQGLMDIIHVWFESLVEAKDVYSLALLLELFDNYSSFKYLAEQVKILSKMNDSILTVLGKIASKMESRNGNP